MSNAVLIACALGANISPALQSAADDCVRGAGPCAIEISDGECSLGSTVELCPGVEISGASEQHTVIRTATTAFHVRRYGSCRADGVRWTGSVRLEKLYLLGSPRHPTESPRFGVHAENNIRLGRLRMNGFTQGVRLVSDGRLSPPGLANLWRMDEVWIQNVEHAGVFVDGGDVNVGLALGLNISPPTCSAVDKWPQLGECAAIVDDAFLGNVYVAPHTAGTRGRSYALTHPSARHALLGAYAEADQLPGYVGPQSMVLGGIGAWEGPGLHVVGQYFSGARFVNRRDPSNIVELELGGATNVPGTFFAARSHALGYSWPLRFKAEPSRMCYRLDVANLDSAVPFRVSGAQPFGQTTLSSSLFVVE